MSQLFQFRSVLYDGSCRMCRRLLRLLRVLDMLGRIVPYDAANDWPRVHERFGHIDREAAMRDMHVVTSDGRTYKGYDGFRSLAWVVPIGWLILPLLYLPPIPQLGRRIYRRIADNRCSEACSLTP